MTEGDRSPTPRASDVDAGLPSLELCADLATSFNRLFILHGDDLRKTFRDFLLTKILDLTSSEFGYIAEVLRDAEGASYLKVFGYALTDIAWSPETRALYEAHLDTGLEFHNLDSIWGEGVKTATTVISNSEHDPRRSGTPHGHPPIRTFAAFPLHVNGELRGQIALANRSGGYENEWPSLLRPILEACGVAMIVARARADQAEHASNLAKSRDILAKQAESALELLRVRDAFISSVVHELRTPMSAMVVYARLLEQTLCGDSELSEFTQALNRNADRLAGLLENVVVATSPGGVPVRLNKGTHDIRLVIERAASDCAAAAGVAVREGLLTIHADGPGPWDASIDALRISQAVTNVLNNALKYAPGAAVAVTIRSTNNQFVIEVKDHGPGMSEDELERSCIAFYRGPRAIETTTGGIGLGLTIADQMIRAHGGDLRIESKLGTGTVVRMAIPR